MNYYKELPSDYIEDKVIDAKNNKTGVVLNLVGIGVFVVVFALLILVMNLRGLQFTYDLGSSKTLISMGVFVVSLLAYIVLHELVHGLFYKIFTHEKLTFGMSLTVAYCGVPNIYVKKVPMIVTILAPFAVFTLATIPFLVIVNDGFIYVLIALFLAIHINGCVGDLYGAFIMIFKYHKKNILVNDTGPKQTFYIKKEEASN